MCCYHNAMLLTCQWACCQRKQWAVVSSYKQMGNDSHVLIPCKNRAAKTIESNNSHRRSNFQIGLSHPIWYIFYCLSRIFYACVYFACALIILLSLCHYDNSILTSIWWSVNDLQHPKRFAPLRCDKTFLLITFTLAVNALPFHCVSFAVSTIHHHLSLWIDGR